MGSADHSDFLATPVSTSQYCFPDPDVAGGRRPGRAGRRAARAAPGRPRPGEVADQVGRDQGLRPGGDDARLHGAFQGFEWTSDLYGHINAYFSKNFANAKLDGYPTPKTFYDWLVRRPELGGGSDALATFNHPGAKDQLKPSARALSSPDEHVPQLERLRLRRAGRPAGRRHRDLQRHRGVRHHARRRQVPRGLLRPRARQGLARRAGRRRGPRPPQDRRLGRSGLGQDRGPRHRPLPGRPQGRHAGPSRLQPSATRTSGSTSGRRRDDGHPAHGPDRQPLCRSTATATWPGHTGLTLELVTSKGVVVASGTDSLTHLAGGVRATRSTTSCGSRTAAARRLLRAGLGQRRQGRAPRRVAGRRLPRAHLLRPRRLLPARPEGPATSRTAWVRRSTSSSRRSASCGADARQLRARVTATPT